MPTIAVDKADFYKELGQEFTTEEFDELCFRFGIELDEDTTTHDRPFVDGVQEKPQLKIEVAANRYDMLCFEGIARALNIYLGRRSLPKYRLLKSERLEQIIVKPETMSIRKYVSGAILRNITFDQAKYASFIALQDKLHANLGRNRTLIAIGTHDYDSIEGPFTYEALRPSTIKFTPLNQKSEMTAEEMMNFYEHDRHLGRYLHIIRDSPVYPVIYDAKRRVCSMPPIINSEHSKISPKTKNVFIEATATDKTKLEIVIKVIVAMFSEHCTEPFTVKPVEIVSPHNGESRIVPDLSPKPFRAEVDYINNCTGLSLSPDALCELLRSMSFDATVESDTKFLNVLVPCTRADVLHQCDIMEDVAIAHGYDNLPIAFPDKSATIGVPATLSRLSDIVRIESAIAGWVEVMPLILCSHDESYGFLQRPDDGKAVVLANPKTIEYQIVRTTLLPGVLKTIRENRMHSLPIQIFEVSDVAFKDDARERKARNQRNWAAVYCGQNSGFEIVQGLLDRIMTMLSTEPVLANGEQPGYYIEETNGTSC